jgi:hypothetical protein
VEKGKRETDLPHRPYKGGKMKISREEHQKVGATGGRPIKVLSSWYCDTAKRLVRFLLPISNSQMEVA